MEKTPPNIPPGFFPHVLIFGADAAREMASRHLLLVLGILCITGDDGNDAAWENKIAWKREVRWAA